MVNQSVEEGGVVVVETLEDIVHQRFANKAAAVADGIACAIFLQRTHLVVVEQNTYPMGALWLVSMAWSVCWHDRLDVAVEQYMSLEEESYTDTCI